VKADPASYVGERIVIRGTYVEQPHERLLLDGACPGWNLRVSHSLQSAGNRKAVAMVRRLVKANPIARIQVVYSGVVKANVLIAGCTKPTCFRYSLEESQLLAASPPEPTG
jgi:hypothetical protein